MSEWLRTFREEWTNVKSARLSFALCVLIVGGAMAALTYFGQEVRYDTVLRNKDETIRLKDATIEGLRDRLAGADKASPSSSVRAYRLTELQRAKLRAAIVVPPGRTFKYLVHYDGVCGLPCRRMAEDLESALHGLYGWTPLYPDGASAALGYGSEKNGVRLWVRDATRPPEAVQVLARALQQIEVNYVIENEAVGNDPEVFFIFVGAPKD